MSFQIIIDTEIAGSRPTDFRQAAVPEQIKAPRGRKKSRWAIRLQKRIQRLFAQPRMLSQPACQPVCLITPTC